MVVGGLVVIGLMQVRSGVDAAWPCQIGGMGTEAALLLWPALPCFSVTPCLTCMLHFSGLPGLPESLDVLYLMNPVRLSCCPTCHLPQLTSYRPARWCFRTCPGRHHALSLDVL